MPNKQITPALVELRDAISEAETLTSQTTLSKRDESRVNVLLSKIKALREGALVEASRLVGVTEREVRWFKALHRSSFEALKVINPSLSDEEIRALEAEIQDTQSEARANLAAGSQTITVANTVGGALVPTEFQEDIFLGMAQLDPLLDDSYATHIRTKHGRPIDIPGWDLSSYQAQRITEGNQLPGQTVPTAATQRVNGWSYRAALAASLEIEQDAYEPMLKLVKMAFVIGFARGIGKDLVNGTGTGQPQGLAQSSLVPASGVVLNHAVVSGVSTTTSDLLMNAYFSINRIYRASKGCCWIMNDDTYQWIRSLSDKQARPLLEIRKDKEMLMGKPVIISPSMPGKFFQASPITTGKIIFGDLSRFIVRSSGITLTRTTQASGYIDKGLALYVGIMRADSQVHDPTGGGSPALVSISVV